MVQRCIEHCFLILCTFYTEHRKLLIPRLLRLSHKLLEVTDDAVLCENVKTGETVSIPADTVLLAMGIRPKIDEANALRRACPETSSFLIGDCLYVGKNVAAATQGALRAAAYM
jgi:hypothetical protein